MIDIDSTVLAFAKQQSGKDELTLETTIEESRMDSLDVVELVMRCEQEFDIDLPDPELEKLKTTNDLVKLIKTEKGE